MSSLRLVRRFQRHVMIVVALLMILPGIGSAGQEAPVPVDPGEFYLGASYGRQYFEGVSFRAHQMFQVQYPEDINSPRYTVSGPSAGYLISHETDTKEWIPEVHFGYAIDKKVKGGFFRVEASAYLWERDDDHYVPSWTVPSFGWRTTIEDDPNTYSTGLFAVFPMIDGKKNRDGTPIDPDPDDDVGIIAGWAFGVDHLDPPGSDATIYDNNYSFSQTSGGGDLSVFYDSKWGKWRFSQGLGVIYNYLRTSHWNSFYFEPSQNPASYASYHYELETHMIGSELQYSAGYQPIKYGPTFFTTGKIRLKLHLTDLEGDQMAPGMTTTKDLDVTSDTTPVNNRKYQPGYRKYDTFDGHFGFTGDLGLGISQRILFTRITLNGGGTFDDGLPTPEDRNGDFKIRYKSAWGYYARAAVDIIF